MLSSALALVAALATASGGAAVSVTPHSGGPNSAFTVGFTPPVDAGHHGVFETSYGVNALGPAGRGCAMQAGAALLDARRGRRAHVVLRGPRLCRGVYSGTVDELRGPHCRSGQVCPRFVTRARKLGNFRFRVR